MKHKETFKILSNTFFAATRIGSTAFIFLIISRLMGAEDAGIYFIARRYQFVFGAIALWGLDDLMIREISADQNKTNKYFANYLVLRILIGGFAYVVLMGIISFLNYSFDKKLFISILSLCIIPDGINNLFYSIFVSRDVYIFPTIHSIFLAVTRIIGIILLFESNSQFVYIAFLILISSILAIPINLILLFLSNGINSQQLKWETKLNIFKMFTKIDIRFLWEELKRSTSFALINLLYVIGTQGDVLVISIILSDHEIAYLGAANMIASFLLLMLYGYADAIYPHMSRVFNQEPEEFWQFTQRTMRIINVIFLPIAFIVTFFSDPLIITIFGQEFAPAILLLHWLIFGITIEAFDIPYSIVMKTTRNQDKLPVILAVGMIINLASNWILAPIIGIYGIAISKIISTIFIYLNDSIFVFCSVWKRNWFIIIGNFLLSSLIIITSIFAFKNVNQYFIILEILIYLGILLFSKAATIKKQM